MMQSLSDTVICFDLDDTLCKEIVFLKSGYRKIAELIARRYNLRYDEVYVRMLDWYHKGENAFSNVNDYYGLDNPIEDYLNVYRYHHPDICLDNNVYNTLKCLKDKGANLGIISDGRSITQRNKIEALRLDTFFDNDNIIISEEFGSEKPALENYRFFMTKYPNAESFIYVADNPKKDFIAPNQLGWKTVCLLDDGNNIHQQLFESVEQRFLPHFKIKKIEELKNIVK